MHGGSNISGYTADPVYDGANLARTANAVIVTVNYRLGVMGFFNLGQLKTGDAHDDSGNFALLDIIKALQFVNRNIASFGGNPGNVTLMGESAGAVNVFAVMTSPPLVQAKPALVHRLLPMSGGISPASELPPGSVPTLAPASAFRAQADLLLSQLLVGDGQAANAAAATALVASKPPAEMAAYMRSKSVDAIWTTVVTKLAPLNAGGSGPIPDGTVLPLNPIVAIKSGQYPEGTNPGGQYARRRQAVSHIPAPGGRGRWAPTERRDGVRDRIQLRPGSATRVDDRAVDSLVVPAGDDAGDRLQREDRAAHSAVLLGEPRQRVSGPKNATEQHLVLPLRLGPAAATVRRHLRRGARVRAAIRVREFRSLGSPQIFTPGPTSPAGSRCRTR